MAEAQRPMSAQDALWLTMDRPNNLMVIDGVMLFDAAPEWDGLVQAVTERVIDRFPVFRSRALLGEGGWVWQADPHFHLERHIRRVKLPEPAGLGLLGLGLALGHGGQTKRLRVRNILDTRPLGVEQHFLGKCRAVSNDAFRHAHGQARDGNNQGDHDDDKKDNPLTDAEISEHVLIS